MSIEGASYSLSAPVEHVSVDHCRAHVFVAQQFLHSSDVVAALQEMSSKGVSEGMAAPRFGEAGVANRGLYRLLDDAFRDVMPANRS